MRLVSMGILMAMPAGCAYRAALEQGATAAAADDWQRAYEAYRFADGLKPGRAEARLGEARHRAIGAELDAAGAAVGAGDYATAYDHLESAERLGSANAELDPRIVEARDAARDALLADLAERMEAVEDLGEAYAFVALAKGLQPHSPEVEDAAASLRARVEADTQARLAEARYAEASDTAKLMAELEPEQRTRGRALEQTVEDAWVAHLVDEAKDARSRPGLAAVYWARAHEVGGDAAHAQAAQAALTSAVATAPLDVYVDTQGAGGRHWRLRKTVRAGADAIPSVRPGTSSRWDLMLTVFASDERCAETSTKKPFEKEYKAGTRQVPNPAYAEANAALASAQTGSDGVEAQVEERRAAHAKAQGAARALTAERDQLKKAHDEKVAALEATKVQIAASGDRVTEAEEELAALGAGGDPTAVAQVKEQLGLVRGFHEDWVSKKVKDEAAVATAKVALDKGEAALAPTLKQEEERAAALEEGVTRLAAAEAEVTGLTAKRDATAKTLTEDVIDLAKYAETTWTLACDAPATVQYATSWTTARTRKQKVEARVETTDLERPAHEAAGIQADPKAYPKAKAALVAEADAGAVAKVAGELEALASEFYAKRLEAALADGADVEVATDELVTLCAGAPERVDEATRARVVAYLAQHHGLENAAPLRVPVPPAAPAAPAAEPTEPAGDEAASAPPSGAVGRG